MSRKWSVVPFIAVAASLMVFGSTAVAEPGDGDTTTSGSAPVNASLPVISGEARQGTGLSAADGSWDNSPDSFSYQWRRCGSAGGNCSDISGANSNTYVLRAADVSHTIRIVVTASNSFGSTSATSARTAVVLSETAPPARWHGTGCTGWNTTGAIHFACNYPGSPFLLSGYSKGGSSTLSYVIQCEKYTGVPVSPVVMYKRVWYSKAKRVRGNFKAYGSKKLIAASGHCKGNQNKSPVLIVTLKQGNTAPKIYLGIKIDGNLPWGK